MEHVHAFWKGLLNMVHSGVHNTFAALSYLAHAIQQGGGDVLIAAAMDAVKAAETTGGSGAEKFAAAQAAVIADLATKGLPLITNAINGAIEAAVAQHKAELANA